MIIQDQLDKIIGKKNIINEPTVLDGYSRDMSLVNHVKPDCILRPNSAEEVKKIVKLAI